MVMVMVMNLVINLQFSLSLIFYYIKQIYYILWNQTTIRIGSLNKHSNSFYLLNIFLMCPIRLPLFFVIFVYVIASIAYIHPVYGRIWTHDLLDVSLHPYPLDQASRLTLFIYLLFSLYIFCSLSLLLLFSCYFFFSLSTSLFSLCFFFLFLYLYFSLGLILLY